MLILSYCDPKVAVERHGATQTRLNMIFFVMEHIQKYKHYQHKHKSCWRTNVCSRVLHVYVYKYTTDVAYILQYMLCIDEILIWTLDKNNTKARELPFGVVCSTALFGSTRHCMRLVIQSTVWVWKMWALILAVQLEMRFFQALTVNTVGVLELHWKQLGHIIKPGATDKHQVLWRFFYLGFFWC